MAWWDKCSKIPYENENFQKIVDFYLFNCPVRFPKKYEGIVSQRGKTFEDRKIEGGTLKSLHAQLKKNTASKAIAYMDIKLSTSVDAQEAERQILQYLASTENTDKQYEALVFTVNSEIGITRSVFYSIRNAFAHGSFSVSGADDEKIYCLENKKNGILRARIRLREKTLLKWIELVEKPESWKKQKSKKKPKEKILALA